MKPGSTAAWILAAMGYLALAGFQLLVMVRDIAPFRGDWFLYGRDTVFHDAVVHLWVQQQLAGDPLTIPLWISGLHGGLPTVGAFLWTPLAPGIAPFFALPYPAAQKTAWVLALWIAGIGGLVLGRALRMRFPAAVYTGIVWMLCGHVVTLVHAGHFQKVMALGWLPWMVAGAALASDPHHFGRRAWGFALVALGLGLMLLSGHPQIAYLGIVLAAGWGAWELYRRPLLRPWWGRHLSGILLAVGLGLALGGAQLLPGLEMANLSNRAGGVDFTEATATSYPPGEIPEYVLPRFMGSSVFGDVYTGRWGERIVSDYVGAPPLLLAVVALALGCWRMRALAFWLLAGGLCLVVGLGSYTPLYGVLHSWLPGFDSFRSPGTFMAGTSLAIAVLAGQGLDLLAESRRRWARPRVYTWLLLAILAVTIADLTITNRWFLFRQPWADFQRRVASPGPMDLWLLDRGVLLETHDTVSDLGLRPLLHGGRALNGYHPITYAAKTERDRDLLFNSMDWFHAWGVTHVLVEPGSEGLGRNRIVADFPDQGRSVLELGDAPPMVRPWMGRPPQRVEWTRRDANIKVLEVEKLVPGPVEIAETVGPGHRIYLNNELVETITDPALASVVYLEPGTSRIRFEYRPDSWRIGVYTTGVALGVVAFLLALGAGWVAPRYSGFEVLEQGAPNADDGGTLLDGDLEVPAHSHGKAERQA